MHAWYSLDADRRRGHTVYRTPSGKMVCCMEVSSEKTSTSGWKDKRYLGEVTEWVSTHHHEGFYLYDFDLDYPTHNQWTEVYDVHVPPKYTPPKPRRSFFG